MEKRKIGKCFTAGGFLLSLFLLASCGYFQEQDVPPPAGGELWAEKIRSSYPNWQPPAQMPAPVQFWEVEEDAPLPALPPPPPRNVPSDRKPEYISHKIAPGETLWTLAARYYNGKGWLWKDIFEANRDRISSPSLLKIGCEILIPAERKNP